MVHAAALASSGLLQQLKSSVIDKVVSTIENHPKTIGFLVLGAASLAGVVYLKSDEILDAVEPALGPIYEQVVKTCECVYQETQEAVGEWINYEPTFTEKWIPHQNWKGQWEWSEPSLTTRISRHLPVKDSVDVAGAIFQTNCIYFFTPGGSLSWLASLLISKSYFQPLSNYL